jgi:hypothetical protein
MVSMGVWVSDKDPRRGLAGRPLCPVDRGLAAFRSEARACGVTPETDGTMAVAY